MTDPAGAASRVLCSRSGTPSGFWATAAVTGTAMTAQVMTSSAQSDLNLRPDGCGAEWRSDWSADAARGAATIAPTGTVRSIASVDMNATIVSLTCHHGALSGVLIQLNSAAAMRTRVRIAVKSVRTGVACHSWTNSVAICDTSNGARSRRGPTGVRAQTPRLAKGTSMSLAASRTMTRRSIHKPTTTTIPIPMPVSQSPWEEAQTQVSGTSPVSYTHL